MNSWLENLKLKTVEEHMKEDPNGFPEKLWNGLFVRNDDKFRIELIRPVYGRPDIGPVVAWINYDAFRGSDEHNDKILRMWIDHIYGMGR